MRAVLGAPVHGRVARPAHVDLDDDPAGWIERVDGLDGKVFVRIFRPPGKPGLRMHADPCRALLDHVELPLGLQLLVPERWPIAAAVVAVPLLGLSAFGVENMFHAAVFLPGQTLEFGAVPADLEQSSSRRVLGEIHFRPGVSGQIEELDDPTSGALANDRPVDARRGNRDLQVRRPARSRHLQPRAGGACRSEGRATQRHPAKACTRSRHGIAPALLVLLWWRLPSPSMIGFSPGNARMASGRSAVPPVWRLTCSLSTPSRMQTVSPPWGGSSPATARLRGPQGRWTVPGPASSQRPPRESTST